RHQHRMDSALVGEPEDEVLAAVSGRYDALDGGQADPGSLPEALAELPRQGGHAVEIEDALPVEPGRDLAAPVGRGPQLAGERLELRREQAEQAWSHSMARIASRPETAPLALPLSTRHVCGQWITRWAGRVAACDFN